MLRSVGRLWMVVAAVAATLGLCTEAQADSLTLSFSGDGGGRVTSEPSGVDCIDDCEAGFVDGTAVTLTADPDPGSVFAGWSGSCVGTGTCQLTMDQARSVTAAFALEGPTSTCGRIAYTSSSGRCDQSFISSTTLSVIREMVYFDTDAP